MHLISRAKGKVKNILHKFLLGRLGFGNRVSKQLWEEQFGGTTWDYLSTADEEAHYNKIVEFYNELDTNETILDIGCGKGVLYNYFQKQLNVPETHYTGIDISENAIKAASQQFPAVKFAQVDFEYNNMEGKYDVIVFNETLYYFTRPMKTLAKSVRENLNTNGSLIISMCDYSNHALIWNYIAKEYKIILEDDVVNNKGQKWNIKLIQPVL